MPTIFGAVFDVLDTYNTTQSADWQALYTTHRAQVLWISPLVMAIGIFIAVLKVLMVASVRGRD